MISIAASGFNQAQPEAPLLRGQSKGMARALARAAALAPDGAVAEGGGQKPVQGDAATAASGKLPSEAGRCACGPAGPGLPGAGLQQFYMDLASGTHAGPKPASALEAEARYLAARRAAG